MAENKKWTEEAVTKLRDLYGLGLSDIEIADILTSELGFKFTTEAVEKKRSRSKITLRTATKLQYSDDVNTRVERARIISDRKQFQREEQTFIETEARWRNLLTVIEDSLKPVVATMVKPPKLDFIKPKKNTARSGEEMVLMQSDIHLGKKTERYGIEQAENRVKYLANKVINISNIHRAAYPIDVLNIFYLGDILDGDQIYKTQSHNVDASVVYQLIGTVPTFIECFHAYAQNFKTVRIFAVPGNHGRLSKFSNEDDNFDRIFYHILKIACDAAGLTNIEWNIAESWHMVTEIQKIKFMLIHGNQIRMHMNLPWYGITNKAQRWFTISEDQLEAFDVLCMGHFHTLSNIEWNRLDIYTNGTYVNHDRFSMEMLGYESSQQQWLLGANDGRITWQYKLGFPKDEIC